MLTLSWAPITEGARGWRFATALLLDPASAARWQPRRQLQRLVCGLRVEVRGVSTLSTACKMSTASALPNAHSSAQMDSRTCLHRLSAVFLHARRPKTAAATATARGRAPHVHKEPGLLMEEHTKQGESVYRAAHLPPRRPSLSDGIATTTNESNDQSRLMSHGARSAGVQVMLNK